MDSSLLLNRISRFSRKLVPRPGFFFPPVLLFPWFSLQYCYKTLRGKVFRTTWKLQAESICARPEHALWVFLWQECFTYVLKGHIAVSAAVFPTGTKGRWCLLSHGGLYLVQASSMSKFGWKHMSSPCHNSPQTTPGPAWASGAAAGLGREDLQGVRLRIGLRVSCPSLLTTCVGWPWVGGSQERAARHEGPGGAWCSLLSAPGVGPALLLGLVLGFILLGAWLLRTRPCCLRTVGWATAWDVDKTQASNLLRLLRPWHSFPRAPLSSCLQSG